MASKDATVILLNKFIEKRNIVVHTVNRLINGINERKDSELIVTGVRRSVKRTN